MRTLFLVTLLAPTVALAAPTDPDAVVRRYLERGAEGDLEAAAELIEPGCAVRSVKNVAPTVFLGSRLTLDALTVGPAEITGDSASVKFELTGSTKGDVESAPGSDVQISISGLNVSGYRVEGNLHAVRVDGAWKVACRDWLGRDEPKVVLEPAR